MTETRGEGPAEALVTGAFSLRMTLRLAGGASVVARIKGKTLRPVCGDRVEALPIANEPEWLITGIRPRTNELTRPDKRGRTEVLAANLTCVVVMAAIEPPPDWFVVDRYLAAAENMGTSALIVFNKTDLGGDGAVEEQLAVYEDCGYRVLRCSGATGANLDRLLAALAGEIAIIVGQSGVGKSSIINRLTVAAEQRIATLSDSTGEGRHTTVNSVMLELPGGGAVIDSPGVRDYAPALDSAADVIHGFREIASLGATCRFANCRHLREPDCAVKSGVASGAVSERRYESYKRLVALTRELAGKYR